MWTVKKLIKITPAHYPHRRATEILTSVKWQKTVCHKIPQLLRKIISIKSIPVKSLLFANLCIDILSKAAFFLLLQFLSIRKVSTLHTIHNVYVAPIPKETELLSKLTVLGKLSQTPGLTEPFSGNKEFLHYQWSISYYCQKECEYLIGLMLHLSTKNFLNTDS